MTSVQLTLDLLVIVKFLIVFGYTKATLAKISALVCWTEDVGGGVST